MNGTLTTIERRGLWILSSIVLLSRSAFALLNDRLLYGGPFCDDAYYALSVARHFAIGRGFAADGIHLTNGFQPLNTLLQSLLFFAVGGARFAGLRLCFVLSGIIEALLLWAMATLIVRMRNVSHPDMRWWTSPVLIAAISQTVLYTHLTMNMNGLETALAALFIVWMLLRYSSIRATGKKGTVPPVSQFLWLGMLGGGMVLARIDTVVLVVILAILELKRQNGLRNAAIFSSTAFLVSLPWWIYNVVQFHSLMPMSGQAESIFAWSVGSLADAWDATLKILFFWLPKADKLVPMWISVPIVIIAIYAFYRWLRHDGMLRRLRSTYDLRQLLPLVYFCVFLFFYYLFFFRATWFLERFWHPIEVLWLLLFSKLLPFIFERIGSAARSVRIVLSLFLLTVLALNARWDRSAYHPIYPLDLAELGFWAEAHPGTKLGALQSGEAGFISDHVINLDGKVNADALHARQHDSLGAYIHAEQFDYLGDEALTIDLALEDSVRFGYHCTFVDSVRSIRIYRVSYP